MSVISKQVAHDVAKQIARKSSIEINLLVDKFNESLVNEYNKELPTEVVQFAKKFPHYIETDSYIRVSGNGFDYESFNVKQKIIVNKSTNTFMPDEKVAASLLKMKNEILDKKKEYNRLVIDIENALIQLKTYKNIQNQFPDAIKFLPKKSIASVAINFSDILSRIQA